MTTQSEVETAVRNQLEEMLERDLRPPVNEPSDVNDGFCWYFAECVFDRLGQPKDVHILGGGTMGGNHRWIEHNGVHYDSEAVDGVTEWDELPYWERLPPHTGMEPSEVGHRDT